MFICDLGQAGTIVHAWHLAIHGGLATIVSSAGIVFLGLGFRSRRRARRAVRAARGEVVR